MDVYTREKGLISCIVSGVRSIRSNNKANIYQPANIIDIVVYEAEQNKLSRIKEATLSIHFYEINFNVIKSSVLIFMLEVSRNTIIEKESNIELFSFLEDWFVYLDLTKKLSPNLHIKFMTELSVFAGFAPMNNYSDKYCFFDAQNGDFAIQPTGIPCLDANASRNLSEIIACDRNELVSLNISKNAREQILSELLLYYKHHLTYFKDVLSLDVLKAVF